MQSKIKSFAEIQAILEKQRAQGRRIVQCHGVFDLLHPGHVRHFKSAKAQGDVLVVTITPDRFVNKGPGRPAFTETLRLETLAALQDVDYVILNDAPDAIPAIHKIRPTYYVKGIEYEDPATDITGKITEEVATVESLGGAVFYTDDIVFSSSTLLNQYFDHLPPEVADFLRVLKGRHSLDEILSKIEALSDLKVLVIGDAILDEYQYVSPLGQSGKGLHMVARCLDKEVFLGGSLIIANHIAQFVQNVTLVTTLGAACPHLGFIQQQLDSNVTPCIAYADGTTTLIKKRYVTKDGRTLSKLFETYDGFHETYPNCTQQVVEYIRHHAHKFDLILCADFGNGFSNPAIVEAISDTSNFLALNAQINSGNRGYNVVTNYRRADYISINEPELRLSTHDRLSSIEGLAADISQIMDASHLSITRGIAGVFCYSAKDASITIPALVTSSIDRIGAGDSFLSLSSLCFAKKYSPLLAGFVGSIAAAMSVQVVGNKEHVIKSSLCKFITRLMK